MKDLDACATLKEKSGDYSGAVKLYLNHKRPLDAILQAHRYETKGVTLRSDVNVAHLTSTFATKYSTQRDVSKLLKVLEYIPVVADRIQILKDARYFREACKLLCDQQEYDEVYRIYSAQGMHKEAIQLATQTKDDMRKARFVLQEAVRVLVEHGNLSKSGSGDTMNVCIELQHLCKHKHRDLSAKACLLLGKLDSSIALCRRAVSTYKYIPNRTGEVEAFNTMMDLKHEVEQSHPLNLVLQACKSVAGIVDAIRHPKSATATRTLEDMEEFYNLQKQGLLYCIPDKQSLWVKGFDSCKASKAEPDQDGMLQLDVSKVRNQILKHLQELTTKWLRDNNVQQVLASKLARHTFHQSLLHGEGYLPQSCRAIPTGDVQEYLRQCLQALEFSDFASKMDIEAVLVPKTDIKTILINLFSPQAMVHLTVSKEFHMKFIRDKPVATDLLLQVACRLSERPGLDYWLAAWRLSCVVGDRVHAFETMLSEQTKQVQAKYKASKSKKSTSVQGKEDTFGPGKPYVPPQTFIYQKQEDEYLHVFTLWLKSCRLIRQDCKVTTALKIMLHFFLRNIVNRHNLRCTISVMNVVDVVSICCTGLMAILSSVCAKHRQPSFVVPHTYEHVIRSFDDFNCQRDADMWLLRACAEEIHAKSVKAYSRIQQDAHEMLCLTLDLLTGRYNKHFNVLNYSVKNESSLKSGEAAHCLALTLTMFGNLALTSFTEAQLLDYYRTISTALEPLSVPGRAAPHLHQTFIKFNSSRNVHDVFESIRFLLSFADRDAHLLVIRTQDQKGRPRKCFFQPIQLNQLPRRPFPITIGQNLTPFQVAVSVPVGLPQAPDPGIGPQSVQSKSFSAVVSQQLHGQPRASPVSLYPADANTSDPPTNEDSTTSEKQKSLVMPSSQFTDPRLLSVHQQYDKLEQMSVESPGSTDLAKATHNFENVLVLPTVDSQNHTQPESQIDHWKQSTPEATQEAMFESVGVKALSHRQGESGRLDTHSYNRMASTETDADDPAFMKDPQLAFEDKEVIRALATQTSVEIQESVEVPYESTPESVDSSMLDESYCRFCAKHLQPPAPSKEVSIPTETPVDFSGVEELQLPETEQSIVMDKQLETYESHCNSSGHKENMGLHQVFSEQLKQYEFLEDELRTILVNCDPLRYLPSIHTCASVCHTELQRGEQQINAFKRDAHWRKGAHEIGNILLDRIQSVLQRAAKELEKASEDHNLGRKVLPEDNTAEEEPQVEGGDEVQEEIIEEMQVRKKSRRRRAKGRRERDKV